MENQNQTPIRLDLPQFVHDELSLLHGCKKPNAEKILMEWAVAQRKNREKRGE